MGRWARGEACSASVVITIQVDPRHVPRVSSMARLVRCNFAATEKAINELLTWLLTNNTAPWLHYLTTAGISGTVEMEMAMAPDDENTVLLVAASPVGREVRWLLDACFSGKV